ncbi:tRNA methyltransferase complex GCD14 subunit-domain-containing protein [Syncephalis pseudoplumigaleata]|uniref:tRNA (adenine(58)-N(1))-methyltransferase catalytic subunit TRM61 n=1 Tax=Syncephalis pseudoplumigaleata TaxID=1712513 RepID=A0A4P9YTH1_9FUNG|nr:tRNA methyltransferase complex GCD14 subunit-domain-containing protein [Syncephalis pseudoplumigaleata]|eukprot:RKP23226.1 tRNA methyltransferase complex GCD14 subunit-domain-containing protein [Syncephalis pseudoplumigaleata]
MTSTVENAKPQFFPYKRTIEADDLVIAYMNRDNMIALVVQPGAIYNNRFGIYHHDNFIGKPFGAKVVSHTGRGFMYLLHPTPELWTLVLPHRTQILYQPDISLITAYLELRPGAIVLESGTGSGSFSHSLARTVAPHGHLYTFEFHEARAEQARAEFAAHGLSHLITLACRDACKEGFAIEDKVDAVFLDLPAPWEAIPFAKRAFKQHQMGRIACFSPCIEQVQRTCETLRALGFRDVRTFECLQRSYSPRTQTLLTVEQTIERAKSRAAQAKKPFVGQKRKSEVDQEAVEEEEEEAKNAAVEEEATTTANDVMPRTITTTTLPAESRGHTSYLTFATFMPVLSSET